MDFTLSQPLISPIEIMSESEIFTLRYVLPVLLALPWIIYGLYLLLKWISHFFGSKQKELQYHPDLAWLYDSPPPPERVMTIRELEMMAVEDPRMALRELSRLFRVKYLKPIYRPYSLEFYIKDKENTIYLGNRKWLNLFHAPIRERFTNIYSPIFSEIVELGYSNQNITTERVMGILERVRNKEWEKKS
ncbi:MAG: hypothetical protein JJT78_03905 [Leptospira sp.]|nr:hypothetical protein [Leptospira sp.]